MKILIIHNYYQQPGGERAAVDAQVAMLREHGHRVILYTRDSAEIDDYKLWQKAVFVPEAVSSRKTGREIQKLIVKEHPDLAHVHNVFPLISPSVYLALARIGIPCIQTVHNFRFLCSNGLFYTHGNICERCMHGNTIHAIRWKCYRESYMLSSLYALAIGLHRRWGTFQMVDRFIALTEFTAGKLKESGLTTSDKISVLGNFLSDPWPSSGSLERRESFVLYLGRLSPEKGVDTLIKAMVGLPYFGLKILGDGPQKRELVSLTHKLGLRQVEFLGHVFGEEKWDLLRRAQAVVVPSVCYETFSLAVLESLAVGTPVLATNLGSLPFLVEDGKSGLLYRLGDSQDLELKLAWLVRHPKEALAMGRYGQGFAKRNYSAATHYKSLLNIYRDVTA